MRKLLRSFLSKIKLYFFIFENELISLFVPRKSTGAQKTLVIRMDAIGDFIIWLRSGFLDVADKSHEQGRVILLANSSWADFAESLGVYDGVWPIDIKRFKNNPIYRFKFLTKIRREGFSSLIQPRAAREFLLEDSIVRVSGAQLKIGNKGNTRNISDGLKKISDSWYGQLIETLPESNTEIERSRFFTRGLVKREPQSFKVEFSKSPLKKLGIETNYYVVAPGAGWSGRRWPIEKFVTVVKSIQADTGLLCVIIGDLSDDKLSPPFINALGDRCVNLIGRTTLLDSGAILKHAHFVLGNESGICHFSSHVDTPSVVILGGGHFGWFMPYSPESKIPVPPIAVYKEMDCFGCDWKCKYDLPHGGAVRCISEVPVERVLDAIHSLTIWPSISIKKRIN